MQRILVVYYSQSGDVKRAAEALMQPSQAAGAELVWAPIVPRVEYPWPWRNAFRFFDEMPECVLGYPPEIAPPTFAPDDRFDLVVLAYPVWFLSPAPPVQALFRTPHAAVFRDRKTLTLSVSRNMWNQASLKMRRLLAEAGAIHIDNITATHQGPAFATFLSTPLALLTGKRSRLGGLLPQAGLGDNELHRLHALGEAIARQLPALDSPGAAPLLRGLGAAKVNGRYVVAEYIGARLFPFWGRVIRRCGQAWRPLRYVAIFLFMISLVLLIVLGIPFSIVMLPLVYPLVRKSRAAYIARLKQPSEA